MSSSERSSFLEKDKGNDTQSADGEEKLVEEDVESRQGKSESGDERNKTGVKGKWLKENKGRIKEDTSEKSYRSSISLLSVSDFGKTSNRKRKREKKTEKESSSHRMRRHKDRGEKRRRRTDHSHYRSASDISRNSHDRSGESLYSHHSRERKERKRKKEIKKKGKHRFRSGEAGGREGRYSKLSSFSLSTGYTDADMDLESISDLNYKSHHEKKKKKIPKKVSSDYLSSKNHHHRYDEEKGSKRKREDERKGSRNYVMKKKNGSMRERSREPSYSISLTSEEESKKRKKKKKKKLVDDRSGKRSRRRSSEEQTRKYNSKVEPRRDKFNYEKYHYWRGNSGESQSEEHHNYHHDDSRSPLGRRHSHKGTTKRHTNTLGGDERRGSEQRRMDKKKNKLIKENKAYKVNRSGKRIDAYEYESATDTSSHEVQSRSNHAPTRKKRRPYLSDAESADLAVSIRSDERYLAKGRMPHYGTLMVRRKGERAEGRRGKDGIHHNHDEDDEKFLHSRMKRGDPFRDGRPRMIKEEEEEEMPRFRDREWQPYGETHHREFEKRKIYIEREDRMERPTYGWMMHSQIVRPHGQHNYDKMEYKEDVTVLTKNRRHEHYPEHGNNRLSEVRIPNGMINREKTCPFLLRLFYKLDEEYNNVEDVRLSKESGVQSNELQIYGWLDITMREIVTLVKDFYQESRKRDAHWVFKVYSNEKKELTFLSRVHSTKYNYREDNKTLLSLNYEIGDILLLSIMFGGKPT
ncbi:histone deacetylase complex subunit SAP18, putative [Plasmodium knowlesi strain H]|uniref:Histone deacetylase complex subunit SAP18, putative n=3 Tax=Plasmodium knowlesi TaxID=5850 RepID=B3KZ60_PLAKH|nr:histone deacetylase complex subunit SAP18, putative [Plasmodium knowlesi strain H]OTN68628.1 putative Sin3 associated polypeptide p18-like protein [Plasmodium knowlesi]CAA9986181.1 histone deacetylase complex subunit SAP18, putative [Plasmodium knowlesi strain H]SBO27675.1 sin3 associated polypeptide p18-like protein, putative [Plasmodium knowlesi strain H]VVS75655.1 histone deacetylase complex subunit SAP18, putative [Plasmodium knowlesi strain H]|eukprot:XP_002257592.1 sin3 associated polypeptide p18-like protein,putative [Plasmodium knowlesi strain H]